MAPWLGGIWELAECLHETWHAVSRVTQKGSGCQGPGGLTEVGSDYEGQWDGGPAASLLILVVTEASVHSRGGHWGWVWAGASL